MIFETELSHENFVSQLMNSNDYYVNLRLILFILSCFDKWETNWFDPFLEYWVNVLMYINVAIVPWCFNYRNYHTFHAFAILICVAYKWDKAHCCCCCSLIPWYEYPLIKMAQNSNLLSFYPYHLIETEIHWKVDIFDGYREIS